MLTVACLNLSSNLCTKLMDAVYLINMKREPNVRWEHFKQYLPLFADTVFVRTKAHDGTNLTEQEKCLLAGADWDLEERKYVTGCFLSHYIWKEQVARGYKWVLIFEDDVVIKNPSSFRQHIEQVLNDERDDPLVVFVGQHAAWDISFTDKVLCNTSLGEFTPYVNPCAHAYLVSLKGAQMLLNWSVRCAADHHINGMLKESQKFYGTRENLALQSENLFGK